LVLALGVPLAAVGCGASADEAVETGAEPRPQPEPQQAVSLDPSILDDPSRPEAEVAQDADRRPLEVYEFFGVQPGMTVADVYNGDGYNTHLLARAVGDEGRVYSVFEFYTDRQAFDGQIYKVDIVTQRVQEAGLDNVELAMALADVPTESVDVAVAVRNYHDVEHVFPDIKRADQVAQFFRIVKPGGYVGIVEVATPAPGWDDPTHRLGKQMVIDDFTAGGFELVGESDLLANPDDDHSESGFAEGRHKTDRYTLKFRKPAG
jgi:predicted methyltransferase